jgi:hypothetical protein
MPVFMKWKSLLAWIAAGIVAAESTAICRANDAITVDESRDGEIQLVAHRRDCPCETYSHPLYRTYVPCPETTTPGAETDSIRPPETEGPLSDDMADMGGDVVEPDFAPGAPTGMLAASFADPQGYIDIARIRSRVRVRYDDMQGANKPTRAEYMYPTIGEWRGEGPPAGGGPGTGGGQAGDVDMRELITYVEAAWGPRFSVFGEFPVRWVDDLTFGDLSGDPTDPFDDGTQAGAGDFRGGVRYGIFACPDEWLTLQVRAWAPTGEARRALGVGHSSIDVALLYEVRSSERATWFAELSDWQSIDAGTAQFNGEIVDIDGNVMRYGIGLGYDLWQSCGCRPQTLTGVFEVVGWTVFDGVVTSLNPGDDDPFEDAEGDTIINGKYGLRYNFGCESIYFGYGHNWTDERWYSDIFRFEVTHYF